MGRSHCGRWSRAVAREAERTDPGSTATGNSGPCRSGIVLSPSSRPHSGRLPAFDPLATIRASPVSSSASCSVQIRCLLSSRNSPPLFRLDEHRERLLMLPRDVRIAVLTLGGLAALLLAVVAFGYALPVGHVATRDAVLQRRPTASSRPARGREVSGVAIGCQERRGPRHHPAPALARARRQRHHLRDGESEPPRRAGHAHRRQDTALRRRWTTSCQPQDGGTGW